MRNAAIAIIANDGYLAAYGLKALLQATNIPHTISLFESVAEFSKRQDEFSIVFSFLPIAGIKTVVIDSKASKAQLHKIVSQAFNDTKTTPSTDNQTKDEASVLSKRELEVLKLVASGLINKEIAERMNISLQTVLSHRKHISAKLGIRTTSGFTAYAMINGLV